MTDDQIQVVERTWRLLRPVDPRLLSAVFLTRLQLEAPAWKPLAMVRLQGEASAFIDDFSRIIARLNQPEANSSRLLALATHYLPDVVSPQQILSIGRALLWTIEQGVGADWNGSVEQAWRHCYIKLGQVLNNRLTNK